jgi:hypothetical protein
MTAKFGSVFSEQITGSKKRLHSRGLRDKDDSQNSFSRRMVMMVSLVLAFGVLFARLFYLTVIDHEKYKALAQTNRVREETIPAPRGIIYDRNGTPLVRNIPGFKTKEGDLFLKRGQPILRESLRKQ